MATKTNVTGASWPTSGTATAASIGIFYTDISGTHVGYNPGDDRPTGSVSTGYVTYPVGTGPVIQVDPTSGTAAPFGTTPANGNRHVFNVWLRARRVDPTLASTSTSAQLFSSFPLGSINPYTRLIVRRDTNDPARGSSLALFLFDSAGGTGGGSTELGFCRHNSGVAANAQASSNVEFERWFLYSKEINLGAPGSAYDLINGQRTSDCTGNTGTTAAQVNAPYLALPALAGVVWDVEAISSYSVASGAFGAGEHPSQTVFKSPNNYTRAFAWPVTYTDATTATEGANWFYSTTGSPLVEVRPYSLVSGVRPGKERVVVGFGAAGTFTMTSARQVGTLPYENGAAYISFEPVLLRANASGSWRINDTGGSSTLTVAWNTSTGRVSVGGVGKATIDADKRYSFHVLRTSDGRQAGVLINWTDIAVNGTARTDLIQVFALDTWTPADVGTLQLLVTATGVTTFETEGAAVDRMLALGGCDSYYAADTNSAQYQGSRIVIGWTGGAGSFAVAETVTETTSTATATVVAVDNANKWMVLAPVTGTIRGGLTLTGGTSGATGTGGAPQFGAVRTTSNNSASVYNTGQDAFAAHMVSLYKPVSGWVPIFAGTFGRQGHRLIDIYRSGVARLLGLPNVYLHLFGGPANDIGGASTTTLADSIATEWVNCLRMLASVAEYGGVFVWVKPTFGSAGGFAATYARRCFDKILRDGPAALRGNTYGGRVVIADPGNPAFTDGIHYSAAGASTAAGSSAVNRRVLTRPPTRKLITES